MSEASHHDSPIPECNDRVLGGRYCLISQIARGGMAEVWKAYDELLARPVAIKFPLEHLRRQPEFSARFQREAVAAARLNHPNVVAVYDTGTDQEFDAFIVMELVPGRSLRQLLATRGKLPVGQAVGIAVEVATALDFAHRKGIIHRDVKPANVLLADGVVKVADFGIAKAAMDDDLTKTSFMLGTARYCSPEQVEGKPLDPRSDIYSLGVLLYEMICGCPPFEADSELALALKHVTTEALPPSRHCPVPDWLEEVIQTAMNKSPDQRFRSASAMRRALIEHGQTEPEVEPDVLTSGLSFASALSPVSPAERGSATEPTGAYSPIQDEANDDAEDEALATRQSGVRTLAGEPVGGVPVGEAATAAISWEPDDSAGGTRLGTGPGGIQTLERPAAAPPLPGVRRWRIGPAGAIAALVVLVVGALVAATLGLSHGGSSPSGGTAGGTASSGAAINVVGAQSFNPPPGDGSEHQELVKNLYDGNPDTYWTTQHYASSNFGNLKTGVGVYLQLPSSSAPARMVISSPDTGWRFSIYESSSPHSSLSGWGQPVASGTQTASSVTVSLPGKPAPYVLLWITYLGDGSSAVRVGEISFQG